VIDGDSIDRLELEGRPGHLVDARKRTRRKRKHIDALAAKMASLSESTSGHG